MIVIIVLFNICIGLLNNTINNITEQKAKYWKLARTQVWLRFITDSSMPPPFNVISYLIQYEEKKNKKKNDDIEINQAGQSDYLRLIYKLSKRYRDTLLEEGDRLVTKSRCTTSRKMSSTF